MEKYKGHRIHAVLHVEAKVLTNHLNLTMFLRGSQIEGTQEDFLLCPQEEEPDFGWTVVVAVP